MNKELSDKIRIASLLCTFMVIMRHARNLQAFWGTEQVNNWCAFVENGFSVLTEIAIPYFFVISGFFFFRYNYYQKGIYCEMLKKKIWTLLIPFVFWNVFWAFVPYLSGQMDSSEPFMAKLLHLLFSDYYGALWYVRNLMLLMLLVPLYHWIFLVNSKWLLLVVGGVLMVWWWPVDCAWYSTEGVLFFYLGGLFQRYPKLLSNKLPMYIIVPLFILWCILAFERPLWSINMNKFTTLLGLLTFWNMLDRMPKPVFKWLLAMTPITFFIYVTHFYVIKIMKVAIASIYPGNEAIALLSYFLLPVVAIVITWFWGQIWQKTNIWSFNMVTGGRAKQ